MCSCLTAQDIKKAVEAQDEPSLSFPDPYWKLVPNLPPDIYSTLQPGDELVFATNQKLGFKKAVIGRETDNLTPEEIRYFAAEVASAILTELKTWRKYDCFSRRLRKGAENVIDVRWVLKWKWIRMEKEADYGSGCFRRKDNLIRVIRARLTVRGFKDQGKYEGVSNYAGTTSRYSQQ